MHDAQVIRAFFNDFVLAFASFQGEVIAQRYAAPYLALRADASHELFASDDDIARYFQNIVDGYYQQGARSCRYRDFDWLAVGPAHVLATVTWELLDSRGEVISAWRESYTLALQSGTYRITTSIDH